MSISRARVEELLERMRGVHAVVAGDVMLDRYLVGDIERISPEAPVPVVHVAEQRAALGGAANVAANVTALGARCTLVGVIGTDGPGDAIQRAMADAGLDPTHLLAVHSRPTTSKTRLIARGQQVVRFDEEVNGVLEGDDLARLTALALDALGGAHVLLLEDYDKGALAPSLIRAVIAAARERGIPVVVDPKFRQFFDYGGATVFKPNRRELETALGAALKLDEGDSLPGVVQRLGVENLLLTLGASGMALVTTGGHITRIPSMAREVYDVSGAGDTVTAWVGCALAAGATLVEAAQLATYAAGVEVGKPGVAAVFPAEVLEEMGR